MNEDRTIVRQMGTPVTSVDEKPLERCPCVQRRFPRLKTDPVRPAGPAEIEEPEGETPAEEETLADLHHQGKWW